MPEEVRREEHQNREHQKVEGDADTVLGGIVGMERQRVLRPLHVNAERVVRPRDVQSGNVQEDHAGDHERHQIVQREEAVQRGIVD